MQMAAHGAAIGPDLIDLGFQKVRQRDRGKRREENMVACASLRGGLERDQSHHPKASAVRTCPSAPQVMIESRVIARASSISADKGCMRIAIDRFGLLSQNALIALQQSP